MLRLLRWFVCVWGCVVLSNAALAQYATEIIVAQDSSGDFTSIQEAIDQAKAFPDKRITIFIKKGIYREKVKVHAWNTMLTLKGEDAATTIITYDDYFDKIDRGRNSTFHTYTVLVQADDFRAEQLTIENTAGPVGQAVALAVESDRCVFRNCRILGNQDTLYAAGSSSRQYFVNCYIEGTTDFIFGAATALFDTCTIHSKSNSYITAASTPEGRRFGYVFRACRLTAAPGVDAAYLGRPWRDHAHVAFIFCEMGGHIAPAGWQNWSGTTRDKTAYYAEYGNSGPGAGTAHRVSWSHHLSKKEAGRYTLKNILKSVAPADEKDWTGASD
ncbi:MAG: pectin esterase [Lewinellaceae bacterium]|nr:pectin esterase [Lewinellaceae bacterium]